jgi:hypothetical protein
MLIQVPFSVADIQQCKESLTHYSKDPGRFTTLFHTLTLTFDLSWRDIQFILASCRTTV